MFVACDSDCSLGRNAERHRALSRRQNVADDSAERFPSLWPQRNEACSGFYDIFDDSQRDFSLILMSSLLIVLQTRRLRANSEDVAKIV